MTVPPRARVRTWAPRQTPSTGTPRSTAFSSRRRSLRMSGTACSSHACAFPPMGMGAYVVQVHVLDSLVPGAQAAVGRPDTSSRSPSRPRSAKGMLLLDDEDRLHSRDASRLSGIESSGNSPRREVGLIGYHNDPGRPKVRPEALEGGVRLPCLEAIFTRRARRFALGAGADRALAFRLGQGARSARIRGGVDSRRRGDGSRASCAKVAFPHRRGRAHGPPTSSHPSRAEAFRARSPFVAPSSSGRTTTASSCSAARRQAGALRPASRRRTSATSCTAGQSGSSPIVSTFRGDARTSSSSTSGS